MLKTVEVVDDYTLSIGQTYKDLKDGDYAMVVVGAIASKIPFGGKLARKVVSKLKGKKPGTVVKLEGKIYTLDKDGKPVEVVGGNDGKSNFWSETKKLTNVQNAYKHFKKHKKDFPEYKNAKQYVDGVKKFIKEPPAGTLKKTNSDGYTFYYNQNTNTFAVTMPDGTPMTMFKPKDGKLYYEQQ